MNNSENTDKDGNVITKDDSVLESDKARNENDFVAQNGFVYNRCSDIWKNGLTNPEEMIDFHLHAKMFYNNFQYHNIEEFIIIKNINDFPLCIKNDPYSIASLEKYFDYFSNANIEPQRLPNFEVHVLNTNLFDLFTYVIQVICMNNFKNLYEKEEYVTRFSITYKKLLEFIIELDNNTIPKKFVINTFGHDLFKILLINPNNIDFTDYFLSIENEGIKVFLTSTIKTIINIRLFYHVVKPLDPLGSETYIKALIKIVKYFYDRKNPCEISSLFIGLLMREYYFMEKFFLAVTEFEKNTSLDNLNKIQEVLDARFALIPSKQPFYDGVRKMRTRYTDIYSEQKETENRESLIMLIEYLACIDEYLRSATTLTMIQICEIQQILLEIKFKTKMEPYVNEINSLLSNMFDENAFLVEEINIMMKNIDTTTTLLDELAENPCDKNTTLPDELAKNPCDKNTTLPDELAENPFDKKKRILIELTIKYFECDYLSSIIRKTSSSKTDEDELKQINEKYRNNIDSHLYLTEFKIFQMVADMLINQKINKEIQESVDVANIFSSFLPQYSPFLSKLKYEETKEN